MKTTFILLLLALTACTKYEPVEPMRCAQYVRIDHHVVNMYSKESDIVPRYEYTDTSTAFTMCGEDIDYANNFLALQVVPYYRPHYGAFVYKIDSLTMTMIPQP